MQRVIKAGFKSGVSLMPLLPWISDSGAELEYCIETLAESKVHYVFPAGLALYGSQPADSRTLVLRAIERHYPHLLDKYQRLFVTEPAYYERYQKALGSKTAELLAKYRLPHRIVKL